MNKNFWCGNFELINVTSEQSIFLENLINIFASEDIERLNIELLNDDLFLLEANFKVFSINLHTVLFFHDANKYWSIFKNLDLLNTKLILEDFLSVENHLNFSNLNDKKPFYQHLSLKVENGLNNEDDKIDINLLLSCSIIKEMIKTVNKFNIPANYQNNFLKNLSNSNLVENNWIVFKKLFKQISEDCKISFFKNNSFLIYLNPMIKSAYSYIYKDEKIRDLKITKSLMTRNNLEKWLLKNTELFDYFLENELASFFIIMVKSQRKEVVLTMLELKLVRRNFFNESDAVILYNYTETMDIDLNKHFLYQELQDKLKDKEKIKVVKI